MNESSIPKNMLVLQILEILKKYTSENHRLTVMEIKGLLEKNYNVTIDRKAIRRNLDNLIMMGYNVEYSEKTRIGKFGEEEIIQTDWYLEHEFDDSELRLLIDSLLFSDLLSSELTKDIIDKLKNQSNIYFREKVKHVIYLPNNSHKSKDVLLNVEILEEAIKHNQKVSFSVCSYQKDKKLHERIWDNGELKKYVVNPYQLVVANGKYYLIGNIDKYNNIAHFRIDRLKNITPIDGSIRKAQSEIPETKYGLTLGKHMAEHIYMFSGESSKVTFKAKAYLYNDLMDWFGNDIRFIKEENDEVLCETNVNLKSMKFWALQYATHVKVISPQSLVEDIKTDLLKAIENYND
ncbi:MAG: WYL domain-containing protein [Clostridia bacterium]|nr:WYL domain-containing protein [Clostridia bacterium]MBQ4072202.1 WYL domain-containing protein [Clostridia bacterium]